MENSFCDVCNSNHDEDQGFHNSTKGHRFNFMLYQFHHYRKALVRNRHGIEIDVHPKQVNGYRYNYTEEEKRGKHTLKITPADLCAHNNKLEFVCVIKNKRRDSNVILTSAMLLHPIKLFSLTDTQGILKDNYARLKAGTSYTIIVTFNINKIVIGSYRNAISFNFQTIGEKEDTFTIARNIIVSVEEIICEPEAPTKSPFTSNEWHGIQRTVPPTKTQRNMCRYPIPPHLFPILRVGLNEMGLTPQMYNDLIKLKNQLRPGYVTMNNYNIFWHTMLWMEEISLILMLKRYNMENVHMTVIGGERLELEVPGLAEKRPSLVVGDLVDIRVHADHVVYQGVINAINDKTIHIDYVSLELVEFIGNNPTIELDVRFVMGRLPLERMHQGVDSVVRFNLVPSLFPAGKINKTTRSQLRTIRDSEFVNESVTRNQEQRTAVVNILNGTSGSFPYIVFGPPGTGKTVTIVEAILQLKKRTGNKILVCAPANAACDMLTEKLMPYCTQEELIRIMSQSVDKKSLNPQILEYSNWLDGKFFNPTSKEIGAYRIVVTTLILIGRYSGNYNPDVVFIDEAAQACEPEASCALGMLSKGKQVVLAGDPKQLGPISGSKVADGYGLGKSLLERLMDLELYSSLDANYITMLKQNFRSHSEILIIPNKLFYNNMLQPMALQSENDPLAEILVFEKIAGLYNKKKRIVHQGHAIEFCSVISEECRQGKSPSYFNTKEMQMVLKYVQALTNYSFNDPEHTVLPEQIGVVTPYIRQMYKIRDMLRTNNFEGVDVGTTESFQGREKRVIIISTVRAKHNLLAYDRKYNLGFVRNEKRFNVAITRAMSKLIVIGCPHVLGTDSKWLSYINLCEDFYSFRGAPYARRTEDIKDDIISRFSHLHLLDSQHNH
ncbi:hypothetical protein NQ315_005356 [Exocentrus adspersus]|uniref:RNA helicase n=1 Tax=Exocentrus adspersus TaxID=1586481 RepID=A0AAV8W2I9_9CUCU|nr:hypothetical protein NQ315_005356 [Exocentrus adspersus]